MQSLFKPTFGFTRVQHNFLHRTGVKLPLLILAVFFLPFSIAVAAPGAGGPDGFGYKWKDSDEPNGPLFNYIDISSTGTLVEGLLDDNYVGSFPIGFTFNFYGSDYTAFNIASNGFIGFGPADNSYKAFTNRPLPSTVTKNIIAWLWDDLYIRDDTQVYYQGFPDKLIIQFVQYGNRSLANERVNAEIILYPNGKILIQYLNFTAGWPLTSCSVGLGNADGSDGLEVIYNAPYLHNALALQFNTRTVTPPDAPVLLAPANNTSNQTTTPALSWNASESATSYRLQVATDAQFNNKALDDSTLTATSKAVGPLLSSKTYFWRVNAKNLAGTSAWSPSWKFTTKSDPLVGGPISTDTKSYYYKSNQSKVFFHDGQWWAIALNETNDRWQIWRYDGTTWVAVRDVQYGTLYYCDAVLNASANKLLVFGSHKATPFFRRFTYAAGTWNLDPGYPVTLADFAHADNTNPASLVRAKNGELWIFRIKNKKLETKRSTNGGYTWSAITTIKAGLRTATGITDAVAFSSGGMKYIGVAYAERDSLGSKFGFLRHTDGDPVTTWTDESAALTYFGSEHAYNQICLTSDASNNVYLFTRNTGFTGKNPRNTLYKRPSTGVWKKFKVNSSANWKTPAIAIDATNNRLYCMGVNNFTLNAEYKTCLIGQEGKLDTSAAALLFSAGGDDFDDLSVPAISLNAASGLMVCVNNVTTNDIWYKHQSLGATAPLAIGTIALANNQANANSMCTIPLTLSNAGALTKGNGMISIRFPNNTLLPNTMAPSEVLVNGQPVSSLAVNSSTRQVSLHAPVNLANNQSFSVVFKAGAGILNPSAPGSFKLTAWTSAQPAPVNSGDYNISAATTTITPAAVTLSSNVPRAYADYTLAFNLGAQGRMLPGVSTFTVKFNSATTVTNGPLSGVTVNTANAAAMGDSALRQITITLPAAMSLGNNAAVTLFLPSPAVRHPKKAGDYTLQVWTSVEPAAVTSNPYEIPFIAGQPIPNTVKNFDRSNQSKLFYHGNYWWVIAEAKDNLRWYLWKFNGADWEKTIQLYNSSKVRPDCIVDSPNNKAFILLPGGSTTYILRLSFAADNWTIDAGYPYAVPNFTQDSDHGINLLRAKNGYLWVFRIINATLSAMRSSNGGQTWSAEIIIKTGLHHATGLTDAVAFTIPSGANSENYIGVGYAENSASGSVYGFLRHKDADANNIWTDETGAIQQFSGTTSDDHISMAAYNSTILMIVKTNGGGPNTVNTGLLRRDPSGVWFQHKILLSTGWTRPALAIDATHNELYVFGVRESAPKFGEMKHVPFGAFDNLLTAPIDTIFSNEADSFFDMSVAAHLVNGTMNLLICNGNESRDELWYNLIELGGVSKISPERLAAEETVDEENFAGVKVFPNPFNPETSFRFKVNAPLLIKLHIFNLSGQLVRTLVEGELPAGVHQRRWNGRNNSGQRVASGLYLYRLQMGEKVYKGGVQMIK